MTQKEAKDDDMTPDERLAFLRSHGIEVTTPEERATEAANTNSNNLEAQTQEQQEQNAALAVSYVLIPADKSKPCEEFSFVPPPLGQGGIATSDPLAKHLKRAFRDKSDKVDLSLLNKVGGDGAASLLGSNGAPASVSDATLHQVAAEGNVETFSLVHPTTANQYTGVTIYLDEVGMLKRLPLNARASDLALRSGFNPPPQFFGDVFIGRVQSKPCARNISFNADADLAPDAEWLLRATMENLSYQTELNSLTGRSDTQANIAGQDGKEKVEQGYTWTQTEEELEIVVGLPSESIARDINVKFNPQSIAVGYKKEPTVLLKLFHRVDVDTGTWTLEKASDKRKIVISVEKAEQAFWPRIED